MTSKLKNLLCWQYVVGFLLVWAMLTAVNLHWLIDNWYQYSFNQNVSLDLLGRIFAIDYLKDPAYFFVQAVLTGWLSFNVFFGVLIFACLSLKFSALLQVSPRPGILDVAPYLLVLGFLHEGIQMRIAIALSIAIWSLIFFVKNQRVLAAIVLVVASTFHISVSTFFIVFISIFLYERFGKILLLIGAIFTLVVAYTTFGHDLFMHLGTATNARFLNYPKEQNSTGLFQYFVFFNILLTGFVYYYFKPKSAVWETLYCLALSSGLMAIAILQILRFSVVTSSRLAELLSLPVLLVLGATLSQLKNEKKYWPLVLMMIALFFYCALRGYVSFSQPHLPIL